MSKKTVVILWIVAAALSLSVVFLHSAQKRVEPKTTKAQPGDKVLPDLSAQDVVSITLQENDKTVTLSKNEDLWRVNEREAYPADVRSINGLLRALVDLEVAQPIAAGPEHNSRFGLNSDEAIQIRLETKDSTKTLYVGKTPATRERLALRSETRFVRLSEVDDEVYVVSGVFARFEVDPALWLNDEFLIVDQLSGVRTPTWEVYRPNSSSDFIGNGRSLTQEASQALHNLFRVTRFEDVSESPAPADALTVELTTFEGLSYSLRIWTRDEKSSYLRIDVTTRPTSTNEAGEVKNESVLAAEKAQSAVVSEKLKAQNQFTKVAYIMNNSALAPLLMQEEEVFASPSN